MFSWAPLALFRFCIFFVSGILTAIYAGEIIPESTAVAFLSSVSLLYFLGASVKKWRSVFSEFGYILVIIFSFLSGYLCLLFNTSIGSKDHFSNYLDQIQAYQVSIIYGPEEKQKSYKLEAVVKSIRIDSTWLPTSGKVLLYISKTTEAANLSYGDLLLIKGSPVELQVPMNPHEFDYKRFLSFKNVHHQQFMGADKYLLCGSLPESRLMFYAQNFRKWAARELKANIVGEQQQAIAMALVLGIRDGIDNEIQEAYAASGAMHVLAVSGLHVGVIYMLLNLLLIRIFPKKKYNWIKALVCIIVLWMFAFVTGLSASVLRAVTMFSFFALASAFGRGANVYNTLAGAALVLLLFDPYLIMSVGFQLSFLAVIGIVSITQGLYQLWEPPYIFIDNIWKISCVALAAQLSTFALGMLYFHQFPVYFFFSNLFVIPGAFIILLAGISCLLFSLVPFIAQIVGGVAEVCIWLLNRIVLFIEALPYSKVNDIYIDNLQTWLLLLCIAGVVAFFYTRRIVLLKTAFGLAVIFALVTWVHFYQNQQKNFITFYKINGHTAIDWIQSGTAYFYFDDGLKKDKEKIRFHIRPGRLANSVYAIKEIPQDAVYKSPWFVLLNLNRTSVLVLDDIPAAPINSLEVDYLLLSHRWKHPLTKIPQEISFKQLILPSSNLRQRRIKPGVEEVIDQKITHDMRLHGALTIQL